MPPENNIHIGNISYCLKMHYHQLYTIEYKSAFQRAQIWKLSNDYMFGLGIQHFICKLFNGIWDEVFFNGFILANLCSKHFYSYKTDQNLHNCSHFKKFYCQINNLFVEQIITSCFNFKGLISCPSSLTDRINTSVPITFWDILR